MNRLSRCLHYTQRVFTSGLAQQMFNPSLPGSGLMLPSSLALLHHKQTLFLFQASMCSDNIPILSARPEKSNLMLFGIGKRRQQFPRIGKASESLSHQG